MTVPIPVDDIRWKKTTEKAVLAAVAADPEMLSCSDDLSFARAAHIELEPNVTIWYNTLTGEKLYKRVKGKKRATYWRNPDAAKITDAQRVEVLTMRLTDARQQVTHLTRENHAKFTVTCDDCGWTQANLATFEAKATLVSHQFAKGCSTAGRTLRQ